MVEILWPHTCGRKACSSCQASGQLEQTGMTLEPLQLLHAKMIKYGQTRLHQISVKKSLRMANYVSGFDNYIVEYLLTTIIN